jgi:hypothetical protein
VLGTLDAAAKMRPGGLQAGDVPLHDLRYTLCVHSDLQVFVGRVPGSVCSCGTSSLSDVRIILYCFCFVYEIVLEFWKT